MSFLPVIHTLNWQKGGKKIKYRYSKHVKKYGTFIFNHYFSIIQNASVRKFSVL